MLISDETELLNWISSAFWHSLSLDPVSSQFAEPSRHALDNCALTLRLPFVIPRLSKFIGVFLLNDEVFLYRVDVFAIFLSVSSLTLHRAVSVSLQSSLESTPSLEIKDPLASIFSFLYQSFEFGSVL